MENITLIAEVSAVAEAEVPLSDEYVVRPARRELADKLAELWYDSYPPEIATDLDLARREIQGMFSGAFGDLWPEASPLILSGDALAAAICTVYVAPWERTPTCPFIIDLMVHPHHRRKGLAEHLVRTAARAVADNGSTHVALRVLKNNVPALALYQKLGFSEWDGILHAPIAK